MTRWPAAPAHGDLAGLTDGQGSPYLAPPVGAILDPTTTTPGLDRSGVRFSFGPG